MKNLQTKKMGRKEEEENFSYMAAKLEEDTKRREDDGNNDIDACSSAHFRSFGEREKNRQFSLQNSVVGYDKA